MGGLQPGRIAPGHRFCRRHGENLGCRHGRGPLLRRSSTTTRYFSSLIATTDECWPVPARTAPRESGIRPPEVALAADTPCHRGQLCGVPSQRPRAADRVYRRVVRRVRGTTVGNRQRPASRPSVATQRRSLWAAYSPDGSRLATASEDRTARIWDATTGAPITPPLQHRHQVCSLDCSRRWSAPGDLLRRRHCAGMGRDHRRTTFDASSAPGPDENRFRELPSRWRCDLDQRI